MKLYILASLLLAAIVAADEKKSYTGYKLVRVTVPNKEQMDYIGNLEDTDPGVDIWNINKVNGEVVATIMFSPRAYYQYKKAFGKRSLNFELVNNNVQEMLDEQVQTMELTRLKGAPRNTIINKFARYTEINNFVLETVEKHPTITRSYNAGQSTEGRNLPVIVINTTGTKKNVIWIDCGIHAREWVTHPTCIYIIDHLVNAHANNDAETIALLDRFEFHILPLYNPDGYEYSQTTTRLWRKNRKKHSLLCTGTDLNRNADYFWNTAGTGALCNADNYAGPSVASEVETQAVAKAVTALKDDLLAYYTIHSYGNWWLLPYGHDASLDAPNLHELIENGNRSAAAIKAVHGEVFTVGKSSELLYVTTGTTSDWAYHKLNIPISVTVELRPGTGSPDSASGFELNEKWLPEVTKETWAGLRASIQHVAENH